MLRVKIIETETTVDDEIVQKLIGTTWEADPAEDGGVVVDCFGGVELKQGEFEIISFQ